MAKRFTLSFHRDDPPKPPYERGYWYAITADGGYDGVGDSPESAMGDLINSLVEALGEVRRG